VVNATLRPLYPSESPGTHCIGAWVDPTSGLDRCGKSRPLPEICLFSCFVYLFCILCILCFCTVFFTVSPFVYFCLFPVSIQVYRSLPPAGNPICSKYHIIYIISHHIIYNISYRIISYIIPYHIIYHRIIYIIYHRYCKHRTAATLYTVESWSVAGMQL
jgi:hypothetical protein